MGHHKFVPSGRNTKKTSATQSPAPKVLPRGFLYDEVTEMTQEFTGLSAGIISGLSRECGGNGVDR
jgi:hypothetical protein